MNLDYIRNFFMIKNIYVKISLNAFNTYKSTFNLKNPLLSLVNL